MPKKVLILLLFFVLLISACQGGTPSSPATPEKPTGEASPPAIQTQVGAPPGTPLAGAPASTGHPASTQLTASTQLPAALGDTIQCTVVSQMPTPGPTERSLFPPVSSTDWVMGPNTAAVTFIEYGDFQ